MPPATCAQLLDTARRVRGRPGPGPGGPARPGRPPASRMDLQARSMRALRGQDGGDTGVSDDLLRARTDGVGATITGRNALEYPAWREEGERQ